MTIPERIGKYDISEVLGRGAMGVVYKGFDPHIHRSVAIKVIHKELLGDTDAQDSIAARFRNEAQAVGRIAHPGVVAIYEFGETDAAAFIAMEYVQGRNLDQVLAGTPLMDEPQLLGIMDQLLGALAAAHEQGVWHRDIKPANLILTATGQLKLTDFGIARIQDAGLTQVSSMIGTPGYMAPEQYMGEGIDQRADLFACGVLLYRLLTGKAPFAGASETVMYKILNEEPVAPSIASEGRRASAYDAVVARAIAKQPAARFADAQSMRQALVDLANGVATTARARAEAGNDETVIVAPGQWAKTVAAATPGPSAAPSGAGATALASSTSHASAVPAGWDPLAFARVEKALATHIGPMARLMVRKAASTCSDIAGLAAAVSTHIPEQGKRQQFIAAATVGSLTVPIGTATGTPLPTRLETGAADAGATAALPLTDEFKLRAIQVLTRHLGPIARVVVKRTVEQCGGDRMRFVAMLVNAANEKDRAALQRDLGAID